MFKIGSGLNGPMFLNTSSIHIKASDCVQGLDDKYEKHTKMLFVGFDSPGNIFLILKMFNIIFFAKVQFIATHKWSVGMFGTSRWLFLYACSLEYKSLFLSAETCSVINVIVFIFIFFAVLCLWRCIHAPQDVEDFTQQEEISMKNRSVTKPLGFSTLGAL